MLRVPWLMSMTIAIAFAIVTHVPVLVVRHRTMVHAAVPLVPLVSILLVVVQGRSVERRCVRTPGIGRDEVAQGVDAAGQGILVEPSCDVGRGQGRCAITIALQGQDGTRSRHLGVDDGCCRPQPFRDLADEQQHVGVPRRGDTAQAGRCEVQAVGARDRDVWHDDGGQIRRHGPRHEPTQPGRLSDARPADRRHCRFKAPWLQP